MDIEKDVPEDQPGSDGVEQDVSDQNSAPTTEANPKHMGYTQDQQVATEYAKNIGNTTKDYWNRLSPGGRRTLKVTAGAMSAIALIGVGASLGQEGTNRSSGASEENIAATDNEDEPESKEIVEESPTVDVDESEDAGEPESETPVTESDITNDEELPETITEGSEEVRDFIEGQLEATEETAGWYYVNTLEGLRGAVIYEADKPGIGTVVVRFENPISGFVEERLGVHEKGGDVAGRLYWSAPHHETGEIITAQSGLAVEKSGELGEREKPFRYEEDFDNVDFYGDSENDVPQFITIAPRRLGISALEGDDITKWIAHERSKGADLEEMDIETTAYVFTGRGAMERATRGLVAHEVSEAFLEDRYTAQENTD